jgi:hypothetical protein
MAKILYGILGFSFLLGLNLSANDTPTNEPQDKNLCAEFCKNKFPNVMSPNKQFVECFGNCLKSLTKPKTD